MASIKCPSCAAGLKVPDAALGKTIQCPRCDTKLKLAAPKASVGGGAAIRGDEKASTAVATKKTAAAPPTPSRTTPSRTSPPLKPNVAKPNVAAVLASPSKPLAAAAPTLARVGPSSLNIDWDDLRIATTPPPPPEPEPAHGPGSAGILRAAAGGLDDMDFGPPAPLTVVALTTTAAGLVTAIAGALIWAAIGVATGYQIGWIAFLIGGMVGGATRMASGGDMNALAGVIAGASAFFGIVLGNVFTAIGFTMYMSASTGDAVGMVVSPWTLLFGVLATIQAISMAALGK
jgi:hypothetical protein